MAPVASILAWMARELQLRRLSPIERAEPYLGLSALPVVWVLPYSTWTWVALVSPTALLWAFDRAWRAKAPRFVTPRLTEAGVDLVDSAGSVVDRCGHADFDALTMVGDPKGAVTQLRVDRRRSPSLLFSVTGPEDAVAMARELGLDPVDARSRHRGGSLAMRFGLLHLLVFALGCACFGWLALGHPDAVDRSWILRYIDFVWLPVMLLTTVPTWIDVARDGIAWRWLFVRGNVPFAKILHVRPFPKNASDQNAVRVQLAVPGGKAHTLVLGPGARGVLEKVRQATAGSTSDAEPASPRRDA